MTDTGGSIRRRGQFYRHESNYAGNEQIISYR